MPIKAIFALLLAAGLLLPTDSRAQSPTTTSAATPPSAISLSEQMRQVMAQVQIKAQAGKSATADYTNELATLDSLIAGVKDAKTDDAAQITYVKGMIYLEVLKDYDQAAAIMRQITTNYPHTELSQSAAKLLTNIEQMKATQKLQDALAVGTVFPDFSVTNLTGGLLSVGALKGKVVLVDFWATWCPPCRAELPNVIATYQKHHAQGFEIIGVSLDSERDKLDAFLKAQDGMTWPQYFDGLGWSNKLVLKYGVNGIPFAVLIGPDGKILGKELRGEDLENAVAKAVAALAPKK